MRKLTLQEKRQTADEQDRAEAYPTKVAAQYEWIRAPHAGVQFLFSYDATSNTYT